MALSAAIEDALTVMRIHPAVSNVKVDVTSAGDASVWADFDTDLGSTWRAQGGSPSGVRPVETVHFLFASDFPRTVPFPTLRPDFNAHLPHINPHRRGDRVPPCLVFGDSLDILFSEGVGRLFDQMALWLKKAAENTLIDESLGWEATRRDSATDCIEIDVDVLAADTHAFGCAKVHRLWVVWSKDSGFAHGVNARASGATLNDKELLKLCGKIEANDNFFCGETLLAVCWPVAGDDRFPRVVNTYQPDTVQTLAQLFQRAEELGCAQALRRFTDNLDTVARNVTGPIALPIFVVLPIRRPFHLIGLETDYEFLAYRFNLEMPDGLQAPDKIIVAPVLFMTPLSASLLRRTSGLDIVAYPVQFGFVGCGSLGSKIASHLARAGTAPTLLIDSDRFSPHNAARHVIFPSQFEHVNGKAERMASLLATFDGGRKPIVFSASVMDIPFSDKKFSPFFGDESAVLVNTTGSPAVRYFLAHAPFAARVLEACAMNLGETGLLTLEGPNRNPSGGDLAVYAYEAMRRAGTLRSPHAGHMSVVGVGVGCNSVTLPMPDAIISLIAAGVGQSALNIQREALPPMGRVSIASVSKDGMSIGWEHDDVDKTHVVSVTDIAGWTVRILDSAHKKICADVAKYPAVETGGVVVGRVSPSGREVTIVDILDAPPDSKRSASLFELGVDGLKQRVLEYEKSGEQVLWCVGTWHSHLRQSGPSSTDVATANHLTGTIRAAVVLLIRHPGGYSAVIRDGFH